MSRSGSASAASSRTDWERVKAMSDEEVTAQALDDPEAPPLDDAFFERAKLLQPPALGKKHTGLRIDADVLAWFKAQGKGWQTCMNAALRAYVEAQKRQP